MSLNVELDSRLSALVGLDTQPQIQMIQGAKTGFSLLQPVLQLSECVQHVMVAFYAAHKALLIIAASDKKTASRAKSAILQVKKGKTTFAQKSESLRDPIHSSYRHAGDLVLVCQATPQERDGILGSCLDSARMIHRNFLQLYDDFSKALTQFEQQKVTLIVSREQVASELSADANLSTKDAIEKLFTTLHAIQTPLQEVIAFWQDHIEMLSISTTAPSTRLFVFADSSDQHNQVETWLGYQRALLEASSSIAESVDAMSVDPTINPQQTTPQKAPNSVQGGGEQKTVGILQRLWRLLSWR